MRIPQRTEGMNAVARDGLCTPRGVCGAEALACGTAVTLLRSTLLPLRSTLLALLTADALPTRRRAEPGLGTPWRALLATSGVEAL